MSDLTVQHYLGIYQTRLKMQEDGITNPTQEYKDITRTIVEKLSRLPLDEKIVLDNHVMKDSKGNIIVEFPADT
jgi:hypothetical protein